MAKAFSEFQTLELLRTAEKIETKKNRLSQVGFNFLVNRALVLSEVEASGIKHPTPTFLPIHTDQELSIVSGSFHTLKQELHRLLRIHVAHQFTKDPNSLHLFFVHQQILTAGA